MTMLQRYFASICAFSLQLFNSEHVYADFGTHQMAFRRFALQMMQLLLYDCCVIIIHNHKRFLHKMRV